jgi:3-methylcrotonyl-CoA carboxylase alpha subunit
VQVFGDSHGNVVHLFERDCSLQRRHQKVIEEAPRRAWTKRRARPCAAAVRAAKAVDYEGAGTIEFIADASEGLRADRIWFMEMNTRLQVEHPVTEMITGVDLVEWQLRVASGSRCPGGRTSFDQRLGDGSAALCGRPGEGVFAEHGAAGAFASSHRASSSRMGRSLGEIREYDRAYGRRARIDTGVAEGDVISPYYDPMIAKVIWHDEDRTTTALSLCSALQQIEIWPVQHNAQFVASLLQTQAFVKKEVHTGFIEQHWSVDSLLTEADEPDCAFAAHELVEMYDRGGPAGFRLNAEPTRRSC